MDFRWTDELSALAADARAVGLEGAARRDVREEGWIAGFDKSFSRRLGDLGWLGMTWPVELGGHGRTPLERFVVTEALIAAGAPIAASWVGDRQIGPSLIAYGTAEQQKRYLPPLVAGTATWCIGMSEPDAGSDLASLKTRAVQDSDGFVINGHKIWTSFAAEADHCYLIARTDPDAAPHAGLSELIVDLSLPGIRVTPIVDSTGDSHFNEVDFEDVRVPADALVGQLNGSWRQVTRQLEHERGGVDRLMSNRALYEETLAIVDMSDPLVRQEVARLEAGYRIGRLLVLREVLGQAPRSFSAATKVYCTEHEQRVAQFITRAHGPAGMLAGRASRAAVYASAYTIQGGTSSILRTVLADRVLGLPR
jgi:alkylation response protein AidB-like acyl-CoA dehydrogenase